jgi:21S rRNA (GM2251-2'-O)-methyltransferase
LLKTNENKYLYIKNNIKFLEKVRDIKQQGNLIVMLDKIIDPQNFGSIIRTCFYLGIDYIITNKIHSPHLTPAISNISQGASDLMNIYSAKFFTSFILDSKKRGWKIVSTTAKKEPDQKSQIINKSRSISFLDLKLNKNENIILILGSESKGLEQSTFSFSDYNIYIPPCLDENKINAYNFQLIDSLNVGVTAGIIISHLKKQII